MRNREGQANGGPVALREHDTNVDGIKNNTCVELKNNVAPQELSSTRPLRELRSDPTYTHEMGRDRAFPVEVPASSV